MMLQDGGLNNFYDLCMMPDILVPIRDGETLKLYEGIKYEYNILLLYLMRWEGLYDG